MFELTNGPGSAGVDPGEAFGVRARFDGPRYIVAMSGELDVVSRTVALEACTSAEHLDVLVDLSALVFMDCTGYGALATAASVVEGRGGSMVLTNPVGEPLRLLGLIEELELGLCAPLRFDAATTSPDATVQP